MTNTEFNNYIFGQYRDIVEGTVFNCHEITDSFIYDNTQLKQANFIKSQIIFSYTFEFKNTIPITKLYILTSNN